MAITPVDNSVKVTGYQPQQFYAEKPKKVENIDFSKVRYAGKEAAEEVIKNEPEKVAQKGFFSKFLDKIKDTKNKVVMKFKKGKVNGAVENAVDDGAKAAGSKGYFGKFLDKLKDIKGKVTMKFKGSKIGQKISDTGSKLTKTKGGKKAAIAVGVGLILAGIGFAVSKLLGEDDEKKVNKAETKPAEKTNPAEKTKPEEKTKPDEKTKPEDGTDPKPAVPPETPEEKDGGEDGGGEEVEVTIDPKPEENIKGKHKVVKGESIDKMVKDALKEQGIENPTEEQLKAAKKLFVEANKDVVKTYRGIKKEWHGNKFFYPDDEVKIPDFKAEQAEK